MKNKIKSITFTRQVDSATGIKENEIILTLDKDIPAMGYGCDKIRKLLKKFDKQDNE